MRKFDHILYTNGSGLWSGRNGAVATTEMNLAYLNDENDFGELRVYFDTKTWDVDQHGLIYTDGRFIQDLRAKLFEEGYVPDVDYSEQGMQGDDYVSLDVGKKFIDSWYQKFTTWDEECRRESKTPGTQQWAETYGDNLGESED